MNVHEPWSDTFDLLAGAKISRTPRPGECFEAMDLPDNPSRISRLLSLLDWLRPHTRT